MRNKSSRATSVVIQNSSCLLVQEKRQSDFSLQDGRIRQGETSQIAVMREIYEETGLNVTSAVFAGNYEGRYTLHQVFLLQTSGELRLNRKELNCFAWWDGTDSLPVQNHVKGIVKMLSDARSPEVSSGPNLPNAIFRLQ